MLTPVAKQKAVAHLVAVHGMNERRACRKAEQEAFDIQYRLLEGAKLQRMPKPKPMKGRVAFITGGAGGIGSAGAERLLWEGCNVVLADVDRAALDAVVAGLVATALSWPALRTRQYSFFLSTFAAGEALRQCFIQFKGITGGTSGLAFIPRPGFIDDSAALPFLWLVLAVFLILAVAAVCFDASEMGMKIRAVGEDETLSASLGLDAWGLRATAFVLGSVGAGFAGGLLASYNGIVAPNDFGAALMFKIVASCIVGGTRRAWGPLLGLIFLTVIEEAFRAVPVYVPLIWGGLVIVVTLYAPGGLESLLERAQRRIKGLIHA